MNTETLFQLRRYLNIAHHVPGRLRLKFSPGIVAAPGAKDLAQWAQGQKRDNGGLPPGLLNLRLNLGARSLVIDYDRQSIAPKLLEELFQTQDEKRMTFLVSELADSLGLDRK